MHLYLEICTPSPVLLMPAAFLLLVYLCLSPFLSVLALHSPPPPLIVCLLFTFPTFVPYVVSSGQLPHTV